MNLDAYSLSLSRPLTNTHSNRTRFSLPERCRAVLRPDRPRRERSKPPLPPRSLRPEIDAGKNLLSRRWRTKSSVKRVFSRKWAVGWFTASAGRERIFDNPRTLSEGRARERRARIASTRVDACRGLPDLT